MTSNKKKQLTLEVTEKPKLKLPYGNSCYGNNQFWWRPFSKILRNKS
jgi:hypothetical protein